MAPSASYPRLYCLHEDLPASFLPPPDDHQRPSPQIGRTMVGTLVGRRVKEQSEKQWTTIIRLWHYENHNTIYHHIKVRKIKARSSNPKNSWYINKEQM
ncbi:hypothetical protein E2C01_058653 [Portunus trituberculatus]|uniref:Uncharacterized protein n=1 Tax=Portunus trituberculatus TaxID=210409 RepID=A0A5B7H4Q6_PORTR|nr:hypothetical protein [Portunus trituberculatus]